MEPFLGKRLGTLTETDLSRLIDDAVPESLYLDYKQTLILGDREEKKEFLRDVTSFANAEGGLLVYGVQEDRDTEGKPTGVPSSIPGMPMTNRDALILAIEQLLKDGIDERLPRYEIGTTTLPSAAFILLVRIPPSLRAPHMVTLGGERRFFVRINGGKQDMSTAQIRDSVLRSQSVEERVRRFIAQRIEKVRALTNGRPYWVCHIVPLVRNPGAIDVTRDDVIRRLLEMGSPGGGNYSHCIEGFKVQYRDGIDLVSYSLTFRDGTIEFLDHSELQPQGDRKLLTCGSFDKTLFDLLQRSLALYADGSLQLPLAISITLDRVAGYTLPLAWGRAMNSEETVSTESLVVSEIATDPRAIVRPLLDFIWNAFGQPRCVGYDTDGNYIGYRR